MAFNDNISTLTGNSTFYDWYLKENNEIISKLNLITVSGVTSGDGVRVNLNAASGLATLSIGGTSGNILTGLTFSGAVNFLGDVNVPRSSYRVLGITSGTPGYTFGNVVRITAEGYTLAQANGADNAEAIGFISAMTSSYSTVTVSGRIDGNFTTVAGGTLSPGCVYFLDAATAGYVTTTEPSTLGQVSKPVLIGLGETAGVVLQYRGNYLNSSGSGSGLTGTSKFYITLPKSPDPRSLGFTYGSFLSHAPHVLSGNTFFNKVLSDTGRTALSGWFLSGSKNFVYQQYDPGTEYWNLPNEEDFIVGMIESFTSTVGGYVYGVVAQGTSTVLPRAITSSASKQGLWTISGTTYAVSALGATGQLRLSPVVQTETYSPKYSAGNVFDSSPTYWFVNPRPITESSLAAQRRTTQLPETLTNGLNYAFNGDFSIWQRSTARDSAYTTSGNIYFADNWIRRQANMSGTAVQSIQKQSFDITNTDVEGNPKSYIDIKALENPSLPTPTSPVYSVGHVIDGVDTFNGSTITISFYSKSTLANYTANVYLARYNNGSLVSKQTVGTISYPSANTWSKYTLNYDVPSLSSLTPNNDYIEVGIDLNPLILAAHANAVATSTNLTVSLASFVVYDGSYNSPPHQFDSYVDKLRKAQTYYYNTYSESQTIGSSTLVSGRPTLNTFSFVYMPNSPFTDFKLPEVMRVVPTTTVYSPTGLINEMYNYSASKPALPLNLRNTSGTFGYNNAQRNGGPAGTPTNTTSPNQTNIRLNVDYGAVPFDVINCHLVVDASYPI
jgi:hypothetical protein